jgi:rubrerythrin
MKPLQTTPEEVLRKAIQEEVNSREYYARLSTVVRAPDAKRRLERLSDEQVMHRAKLERKYREVVGSDPPPPEPAAAEIPADAEEMDLARIVKLALENERDSESNYRFLAERVPDTELGQLFLELAELEWSHKTELQNEYDRIAPDRFLSDL